MIIALGYAWSELFTLGKTLLYLFLTTTLIDIVLLYHKKSITANRQMEDRFSNGDDNDIRLSVHNYYPFDVKLNIIDEIPFQFQRRDVNFTMRIKTNGEKAMHYQLRPTERGIYSFGKIRIFVHTLLYLVERRYSIENTKDVKVYPAYKRLRQYELMALNNQYLEYGIKKIRRAGNNTEFEQIKDYVVGDDFRTINWKASARRHTLMTNVYQNERSQHVYSIIDKGRAMQRAFNGMTLLDYSINASLALSFSATVRYDKAGLMAFSSKFDTFVPASRHEGQMHLLQERLYAQKTDFGESDFSALGINVMQHESKRSLLILYTDFSSMIAMKRQLPYLIQLAQHHILLVVFFKDMQLAEYVETPAKNAKEYYQHVIADKTAYEKQLIVSTLQQYGIYALLTRPQDLCIRVINKYLEIRNRM